MGTFLRHSVYIASLIESAVFSAIDEYGVHDNYHHLDEPVICNADCFNALLTNLSRPELGRDVRDAQCTVLHDLSLSFMYAALCRNVLIDNQSRREIHRLSLHSLTILYLILIVCVLVEG